ncbi:MAG TPA: hypothetical protein VLW50_16500, partial [Streptosporangiaceae bacterium]|nr:hypothetical protein [Streptosporangiaceae bacterium]
MYQDRAVSGLVAQPLRRPSFRQPRQLPAQTADHLPSASEFVHQNPEKIPSHLTGKLIALQEDGDHAGTENWIFAGTVAQAREAA